MRQDFLFAVVAAQIIIFQFISVRFLRAIPDHLLGGSRLPDEITTAVNSYRRAVERWSYPVGLVLLGSMTLIVYVLPFTSFLPGALVITVASILSSGFFVWTYIRARAAADRIADRLPDSGERVASLDRRTLGEYYNVAWELVPFVLLAVSAALTLWALPRLGQPYPLSYGPDGVPDSWGEGAGRLLTVLFAQGACTFGLLLLTFRVLRSRACLAPRAPAAASDPEGAARTSEQARRRELRFFMAAKVGVALTFTLILFVKAETALGVRLPGWAARSPWAVTGFLLALFVVYIVLTARDRG